MSLKHTSRVDAFLQAQQGIMRALFGSSADEWLGLDLTMAQLKTVFTLQHSGEIPVGGLAERVKVGLPAASIMVDKLVQLGLVARREDSQDRRRTLVTLTSKGEQLAFRLRQGRREQIHALLAGLSEADFAALLQGVEALARVASGETAEHKATRK